MSSEVDAKESGSPLVHYWSFGVGAGRVNEGLRSAWHEHLVRAKKENSRTVMWYRGHVEPDMSKYPAWGRLVEAFVSHLVERYGLDEIQKWYFEVWNEPNLYWGFFHGPKSAYFELYRVSANAVKSVHPSLKVGGPATSNFIADSRHDGEIQDNDKSVFYPQATINEQKWKGVWIEEFVAKFKARCGYDCSEPFGEDAVVHDVSRLCSVDEVVGC